MTWHRREHEKYPEQVAEVSLKDGEIEVCLIKRGSEFSALFCMLSESEEASITLFDFEEMSEIEAKEKARQSLSLVIDRLMEEME